MLRVMTWNLWWQFGPWEARQDAIAAVLQREAPDIVCLQEVWVDHAAGQSQAAVLAERMGFDHAITDDPFGGRAVGFHNAILSRWPLDRVLSVPLPRGDGTPGHRRLLLADAASPWGRWPVGSTHVAYRFDESALRQRQVAVILDALAERRGNPELDLPVVLGGDFNAVPDSDEIRVLTGRKAAHREGIVLTDSWEVVGSGPGTTWRDDNPYQPDTAWPNRRLDYVFVSWPRPKPIGNPVTARLAGIEPEDGVVPSDHAAVVVELRTPDDAAQRG